MKAALPGLVWLLWLAAAGWLLGFHTPLTTDLTFFLPRRPGLLDTLLVQQMREGPASRWLMIAMEGGDEARRAEASRQLADALRGHPSFASVGNGADPRFLADLEQRLFPYRYVLSPAVQASQFDTPALRAALTERLAELATPTGALGKAWLTRDPTGEWGRLLAAWLAMDGPVARRGVWFSPDGRRALLLARTQASGFDLGAQAEALTAVRQAFQALPDATDLRLMLGGPGAMGVAADARITRDAARLSAVNSLLVTALILGVYRSWRVLGLGLIPLLTGVVSGAAATRLVFGDIHGITLGFGATLIGVAADYPNHYFTHLSPREPPTRAMARIWPTLRLGLLTNVAGFAAMLFSGFAGLAQLAVFAGAGLLAAGYSTRWVLPTLSGAGIRLPAWVTSGTGIRLDPARLRLWRWLPPALSLSLLGLFLLSGLPVWNDDVAVLNPVPVEWQARDASLQRDFGAPDLGKLAIIIAPDAESALATAEALTPTLDALQGQGALSGYDLATRYLPSQRTQQARLAALPDTATLAARLRDAQRGLPFKTDAFQPFLEGLAVARQRGPLTRSGLDGTPLADRVDSLLIPLTTGWAALAPLSGIHDEPAIRQALAPWTQAGVQFVDLREASTRLMRETRREATRWLTGSLVLIGLLLAFGLRSAWEAFRVLAPVLMAGFCTAVIMALGSGGLNLYHLVSLLLVMGLSLDQALFFNRDAEDPEERRRTFLSLLVCGASAVLAFGSLAFSGINLLRAIGSTVALGAVLAIGFAALLAQRPGGRGRAATAEWWVPGR